MSKNYGTPRGRRAKPELDGSGHVWKCAQLRPDGYVDANPYSQAINTPPIRPTVAEVTRDD